MKNLNSITKQCLLFAFFTMLFFCVYGQNTKDQLPDPKIKAGIVKMSGSISNLKLSEGERTIMIEIWVRNPVTGEYSKYKTNLDENNRFSIDIPLECSKALVGFFVGSETKYYGNGFVGLEQGKEFQLNIVFDDKDDMKIDAKGGLNLSFDDITNIEKAAERFEFYPSTRVDYYKMTPKKFAEHELSISLKVRSKSALDSLVFSEKINKFLINDFNMRFVKGRLFYYKKDAEKSFNMADVEYPFYADYTAVEPDKSYYSFLRKFNLNNPQYLYCFSYSEFLQRFLSIAAFKIPKIKDTPIDEWLGGVKTTVQNVIGFDSGLFYDMLAANAYAIQLNDRKEPLTDKQVENIKNYYKNKNEDYSKILLKKNEEVINSLKSSNNLKVNETPVVAKEKLIDAIIAKYKGSVVLVDLWATWCSPCMDALKEIEPLKDELKNKGVVFVYLTSVTSPKPLWEGKIKVIGGEQYYLTAEEWEYVMDSFGFDSIPTYLLFDKNGILKQKFTGFPGTDKLQKMIETLLP